MINTILNYIFGLTFQSPFCLNIEAQRSANTEENLFKKYGGIKEVLVTSFKMELFAKIINGF